MPLPTRNDSLSARVVPLIEPLPVPNKIPFIVFGGRLKLLKFGRLKKATLGSIVNRSWNVCRHANRRSKARSHVKLT